MLEVNVGNDATKSKDLATGAVQKGYAVELIGVRMKDVMERLEVMGIMNVQKILRWQISERTAGVTAVTNRDHASGVVPKECVAKKDTAAVDAMEVLEVMDIMDVLRNKVPEDLVNSLSAW